MNANNRKRGTLLPSFGGVMLLILLSWLLVASSSESPLSPFFFFATALAIDASASAATKSASSTSTTTTTTSSSPSPILYKSRDYHLLEIVPHSTNSFTQGLTSYNGHLYEGTGLEYKSQILQHDPSQNMKTVKSMMVEPSHLFGEGITHYYVDKEGDSAGEVVREERMIQLTWKNGVGLIYRINNPSDSSNGEQDNNKYPTWELIDKFSFNTHTGEGWGITFIPHTNEFYVSDGSEYILVWDAETLQEKRRMAVTLEREGGEKSVVRLKYLNELEFVDFKKNHGGGRSVKEWGIHDVYLEQCQEGDTNSGGYDQTCSSNTESSEECNNNDKRDFTSTMSILANVWYQDALIRFDPVTAKVTRVYDLSDIYPYEQRRKDGADCLNGISVVTTTASEEAGGGVGDEKEGLELWVTGKLWPKMYRIRLID